MDLKSYNYVNLFEVQNELIEDVYQLLHGNCKDKIYEHVEEVAKTACWIAEKFRLDKNRCIISSYLHDISAIINPQDMLKYLESRGAYIDQAEIKYPFLTHQRISRLIALYHFNISDEVVLDAIEHHNT